MNKLLLIVFVLTSFQAFGQFDYDLFQQYSDKITRQQNSKLSSVTELQLQGKKNGEKLLLPILTLKDYQLFLFNMT
jgi:hypothetical protein